VGVVIRRNDGHGMMVERNDSGRWSSDGMALWLGRRKNRDTVEWWEEWQRLRLLPFYSSGGCESGCPRRVASGGGAYSILRFQLKRGCDGMKLF
jgi:hypothetical protein